MSSSAYSANLRPDPWLRIVVLTAGRLMIAGGLVMILTLDVSAVIRGVCGVAWLALGSWELRRTARGFSHCAAIRVRSGGEIELQLSDQEWVSGELLSGSIVHRRFAWIRVRSNCGLLITEFLRGDARASPEWRRLQVIWRHIGAQTRSC